MSRPILTAPAARAPYRPGQYSVMYHALGPGIRKRIADAVDELFVEKTDVKRKLNPHDIRDRVLMRQWLLIRDAVMATYQYHQLLGRERQQNVAAKLEAELTRKILPKVAEDLGIPKPLPSSALNTIAQVSHIIHMNSELLEMTEFLGENVEILPEIVEGLPLSAAVGMPLAVVAGLMEIAEAHELGDREAERNAFRHGFACRLVYGQLRNALPANTDLGEKQRLGDRAAQKLLDSLGPKLIGHFLAPYRGRQSYVGENLNRALHDLGTR